MDDRRIFPRYDCAFEVKYATRGIAAIESYTVSSNISRTGIRLPLSRMVRHGDLLELEIDANDKKGRIPVVGKVRWLKNVGRLSPLEVEGGIQFTHIAPHDAERLLQTVY